MAVQKNAMVRTKYSDLKGSEKIAIIMLAVGDERAVRLMQQLQEEEQREVTRAMASLGMISAEIVEKLFADFISKVAVPGNVMGSADAAEKILSQIWPRDRVNSIMEEIRGPAGRDMWEKLGNVNEQVLANYLKNEYPQTVAVILTKVHPDVAGKILPLLPHHVSAEVVRRMLRLQSVQKFILDDVERTLRNEFMSTINAQNQKDSHSIVAEIFNRLDRDTEQRLFGVLDHDMPDSAERVRNLMFTYEDLLRLDDRGVQALLASCDAAMVAKAIKGSGEQMKALVFKNMPERAARMMKEEIAAMGPIRAKEAEEAKRHMVDRCKDLMESGEVKITKGEVEDMIM